MTDGFTVLGIETSCDETAVAVVGDRPGPQIHANLIRSQLGEHAPYGGVVPEIAARAHLDHIDELVRGALGGCRHRDRRSRRGRGGVGPRADRRADRRLDGGERPRWAAGKPFIAVNHLEAHALAARLAPGVAFPYLLLLVPAAIHNCWHVPALAIIGSSAPARRCRRRGLRQDRQAAGPRLSRRPRDRARRGRRRPAPFCAAAAAERARRLRFLVFRAEDGGAADCRTTPARSGRMRSPILAAAFEAAICDTLVDRTANAVAWFRRHYPAGIEPGCGRRGRGQPPAARAPRRARARPASPLSRRRPSCAPTTAR